MARTIVLITTALVVSAFSVSPANSEGWRSIAAEEGLSSEEIGILSRTRSSLAASLVGKSSFRTCKTFGNRRLYSSRPIP